MFGKNMSRIGNAPILIPGGVTVEITGSKVMVKGPKGQLQYEVRPEIKLEILEGKVIVKRSNDERLSRSLHGLTRALINNMILGVSKGWIRNLEMVGVGYRAVGGLDILNLSVGFSHPVTVKAPEGITFAVEGNTKITVTGIDKNLVGQVAANIRAVRPPEVYKGKGIRFSGEYVRKKAGKAGKAVVGAAK